VSAGSWARECGSRRASERLGHPTLEGAAAIREIGEALPKLARRGMVSPEDFPLLRHLYEVIALQLPVDIPWSSFFGGEPGHDQG
jgi:glycerol-3-phosphate dehydrogenase (NAD(P)+)